MPITGAGVVTYNANFTVGATVAGFDVETNGYSSTVEANKTVRAIPWSQVYSVVLQRGGLNPHVRSYRALVYTEADFIQLALLVNVAAGVLITPREPTGVQANLDLFRRGQSTDRGSVTGLTEVELSFTILQ
jgi:hypothetical protein